MQDEMATPMKERVKLSILRTALVAATTAASLATNFVAKKYHYPVMWLNHFLKGSGEDMQVPDDVVEEAMGALTKAISRDSYGTIYDTNAIIGRFCVDSSTLYEGSGFHGRPTLFYLLGGFTFELSVDNGCLIVSGIDEYDWHSDGYGMYFSSPLGKNIVVKMVIALAGKIFGEDLFCVGSHPTMICAKNEIDDARISNKVWEEMYKVGAKSFNSYFKLKVKREYLDNIIAVYKETKDEYREEAEWEREEWEQEHYYDNDEEETWDEEENWIEETEEE